MKEAARTKLKDLIAGVIGRKLEDYSPETRNMPFFQRIFTKEQMVTASAMHSLYTSFGMSVYEQMAIILAESAGYEGVRQYRLLGEIDHGTESVITAIHTSLREGNSWDSQKPFERISKSIKHGRPLEDPDSVVDLFVKKDGGEEYYFGITTVKPNMEGFNTHAKKLLRWTALRLSQNKNAKVNVGVVIPYNPYEPKPYDRWGCQKMFGKQLYVGKDFWNFVAGEDVYNNLLKVFGDVGKEIRKQKNKKND
jgi:hypothetical protein